VLERGFDCKLESIVGSAIINLSNAV